MRYLCILILHQTLLLQLSDIRCFSTALRGSGIDNSGIAELIDLFPGVESLSLAECQNITDVAMDSVAKLKKLTALNISSTIITQVGLTPISCAYCCYRCV